MKTEWESIQNVVRNSYSLRIFEAKKRFAFILDAIDKLSLYKYDGGKININVTLEICSNSNQPTNQSIDRMLPMHGTVFSNRMK